MAINIVAKSCHCQRTTSRELERGVSHTRDPVSEPDEETGSLTEGCPGNYFAAIGKVVSAGNEVPNIPNEAAQYAQHDETKHGQPLHKVLANAVPTHL